MSTNKTNSLGLHSWVRSDRFNMDEFNENFSKLDQTVADKVGQSAFEALKTQLAGKVEQSTFDSLKTQVAAKAAQTALDALAQRTSTLETNALHLKLDTYKGTGTYGSANPRTLTFDFQPKLVMIIGPMTVSNSGNGVCALILVQGITEYLAVLTTRTNAIIASQYTMVSKNVSWEGNSVSWHYDHAAGLSEAARAGGQANVNNSTYTYLAIG